MSDEDLLINVQDEGTEEEIGAVVPTFSMVAAAIPTEDENLDFKFEVVLPEEPEIMDFLSFLFLTRYNVDALYQKNLENAINAYVELREGVGADAAREDIESYLAARVANKEENPLGLRDVEED